MLAENGNLECAQKTIEAIIRKDVWAWESILNAYISYGCMQSALLLYQKKDEYVRKNEYVSSSGHLDPRTFVALLKSCSKLKNLRCGIHIHGDIDNSGLLRQNLFVGSTLVDMYAKCGCLEKAQKVFDELPAHNTVSWNALISGYVEHGQNRKALDCFEQMQLRHVNNPPDSVTFTCCLKACANLGAKDRGQEIHCMIEKQGLFLTDVFLGNSLLGMYAKFGFLARAKEVLDQLLVRDVVSWSALIAGYSEHGHGKEALACFEEMQLEGASPDAITFLCNLKACSNMGAIEKGHEIHINMEKRGLIRMDIALGNTLVDMYAKCGSLATAGQVFEKLCVRNVVSWNALITGYAENEQGDKALLCFEKMKKEGVSPNTVTFLCCLKACGNIGALSKGQEIHGEAERQKLIEKDLVVGNSVVDMYAKCGSLDKAQDVFNKLPVRDIVSWTTLMAGYAYSGESKNVFYIFEEMQGAGIQPNPVTFVVVLNACSRDCLINKSMTYFESMNKDYGIMPMVEHHMCMVDLFGRAGNLEKAVDMIERMSFSSHLMMWHTILGACRSLGNADVGKQAFENAVNLNINDPVAYVLMSHIEAPHLHPHIGLNIRARYD